MPVNNLMARLLVAGLLALFSTLAVSADLLPSWQDGLNKQRIVEFVEAVTEPGSADYLAPASRIAVFDNDGTLWAEEPRAVPFEFVFYRIRKMAGAHPEWSDIQPFKAVIENDSVWLRSAGRKAMRQLSGVAQGDISATEYERLVKEFLATARHPATGLRYNEMVYKPMVELMELFRRNEFDVYIVSGGDQDFIRAYAEGAYGVGRSNIIGSQPVYRLNETSDGIEIDRTAKLHVVNVSGFKVVNIHTQIGRRPVVAFGNSDGDLKMLQYVAGSKERSLVGLLKHDDERREFAVDAGAERLVAEAHVQGWLQISMANDFRVVFESVILEMEIE